MAKNTKTRSSTTSAGSTKSAGSRTPTKADNPQSVTDQEVAVRAREIWLAAGCPSGRDEQNWHEAKAQLQAEAATRTPRRPSAHAS